MRTHIHHNFIQTLSALGTLGDLSSDRRAPAPSRSICQITRSYCGHERLFAVEDGEGGGGGGGDKTFTQTDLDRIVQERVAKANEKIKALEAQSARLAEIEQKLLAADEREKKALEEAELKGKSELEKLQIQVQKANDALKSRDAEWQKKYGEVEALKGQAEQRFVEYVKTGAVKDALRSAGLAKGADKAAALAFMTEAQIELAEDGQTIRQLTVGGKAFDKPQDAAKHFLTENPFFADAPQGGSNSPRGGNGAGPQPLADHTSAESLIGAGLSQRTASS